MKRSPIPREGVYDLYWKFAAKRQEAFEHRAAGRPGPWTDDPIIRVYKFCNVYRAADRVSQYLIREIAYNDQECSPEDRLFQIVAFRLFSKNETWDAVRRFLGRQPLIRDLSNGSFADALEDARQRNGKLYTGAFILCATDAYLQSSKHLNHVELLRHMFVGEGLGTMILRSRRLEEVYENIHAYPLMGDFMSYQIAIDLNYSKYIDFSENDFTQPGPGAVRGLRKAFVSLGGLSPQEAILWMVENQANEFARFGLRFNGLWGRPLQAIDCQGLFCELDKYCREAVPELSSNRSRIKAKFVPTSNPIDYYFPPKWGINGQISHPATASTKLQECLPLSHG